MSLTLIYILKTFKFFLHIKFMLVAMGHCHGNNNWLFTKFHQANLSMQIFNLWSQEPGVGLAWKKSQKTIEHSLLAKLGRWGWSKQDLKHRECGQRTGFPTFPWSGTADSETGRVVIPWRVLGWGEICWWYGDLSPRTPCFVWGSFITDRSPSRPTKSPFTTCRWGVPIITQILHGYPLLDLLPEAGYTPQVPFY